MRNEYAFILQIFYGLECKIFICRADTMTKLMEWVSLASMIGLVWTAAYMDKLLPQYKTEILWSPVVLVVLFGVFSVLTIVYR